MAKRQTREEKAAVLASEQRTRKVTEFKARIAKERGKKVYAERLVWEGDDKGAQALYEMVRRFESAGEDLRKRTERLVEEMQRGLAKLAANESDVFSYSNPVATTGSDIELHNTTRKVLADGIATLAYALGYYVPQIHSERQRAHRAKLVGVDVVASTYTGGTADGRTMWRITIDGTPLTGIDLGTQLASAAGPVVAEYTSEELAWLAASEYVGDYWRA